MSTTVTYKDSVLTTVENATKTLKTAGKYLEDDLTIHDFSDGPMALQTKSVTYNPERAAQYESVTPDSNYDGLDKVNVTVNPIPSQYIVPTGNLDIAQAGVTDVSEYATATVPVAGCTPYNDTWYSTKNGVYKWICEYGYALAPAHAQGWVSDPGTQESEYNAIPANTHVTPSTSAQTVGGSNYMMAGAVTVDAIPPQYIIPSGTKSITSNGQGIDVTSYAAVNVAVPGGGATLQSKTLNVSQAGTTTVAPDSGYDGLNEVQVNVPAGVLKSEISGSSTPDITVSNSGLVQVTAGYSSTVYPVTTSGWVASSSRTELEINAEGSYQLPVQSATTITPTESSQTAVAAGKYTTGAVTVAAIPSNYVGTAISRRSSSDLTVSGSTVTAPAGYYQTSASTTVPAGLDILTFNVSTTTGSATCDHTFAECYSSDSPLAYAAVYSGDALVNQLVGNRYTRSQTEITYVFFSQGIPITGIIYHSNGSIELLNDAPSAQTLNVTANGEYVAGSQVVYKTVNVRVDGGGGGNIAVDTASITIDSASPLLYFPILGEPTSWALISMSDTTPGSTPQFVTGTFDGLAGYGQTITNTSNAQVSFTSSNFYANINDNVIEIVVTGNYTFSPGTYKFVYTYGGSVANIYTAETQVGSGATSITFTGLEDEPIYWSCIFKSNFGTSSGYQRTIAVVNDGTSITGLEMDSAAHSAQHWTASYSNNSLTITSNGTNQGGYFHQPGNYQLIYAIPGDIVIEPESLYVNTNGTYTAPRGKAYTPVTVNVAGGSPTTATASVTNSSATATSISFTGVTQQPVAFFVRCTSSLARSSGSTYYYVADMRYDGTNTYGNSFRLSNGTYANVTSGYSWSYASSTLTITSSGTRTTDPGSFYNGTYELVYIY